MNVQDLFIELKQLFAGVPGGDEPTRLARRVLTDIAGLSLTDQMTRAGETLSDDIIQRVRSVAGHIVEGIPLSRIIGKRNFYGRDFALSPDTLDPRPETELLVTSVLTYMRENPHARRVLDLGAGTGCIGLTIAAEIPDAHVMLTDIADGALQTVRTNADALGVANQVNVIRSDWYENLTNQTFDVIVSNPPYIPSADIAALESNVRIHDPILALDGGADGLDPYRILFVTLADHLNPQGRAWVEFGIHQRDDLVQIAMNSGLDVASLINDYAGIPRVLTVAVHHQEK